MRKVNVPPEINDLAELVGTFIQYWGFKKIHGQIWAHVWLAQKPIDGTTLVKRLGVSKALISLAIKDLLHYDVVKTVDDGDRRKMLLVPNTDVQSVIMNVLKKREAEMIEKVLIAHKHIDQLSESKKQDAEIDIFRLEQLKIMTEMAQMALQSLLENNLEFEKTCKK